MKRVLRNAGRWSFLLVSLTLLPRAAPGQLIGVKTVPVATGDQFLIFPSERLSMGGVSIALDDQLLDPFVNPAKGANLRASQFFGAPMFYNVTQHEGSARTLPLGLLLHSPTWFGGFSVALQQVLAGSPQFTPIPLAVVQPVSPGTRILPYPEPGGTLAQRTGNNMYGFGTIGRTLNGGRTTLAGSVFWGSLNAVDGVDLLYPGSRNIDQYGHMVDYRLGMLRDLGGSRSLALLLLHNRFTMTHDVTYLSYVFRPCTFPPDTLPYQCPEPQERTDHNQDWTRTWGLHAQYQQPLTQSGWRIGGILTGNYKSHPKIPNYELMNIPRDPGNTWALNVGLGVSRQTGPVSFGLDVLYEPMWTHTWAMSGGCPPEMLCIAIVAPPVKSLDNRFEFSNARVRMGVAREGKQVGFQLGMDVYSINYVMRQQDLILDTIRRQHEGWMEWTPTWGLSARFPELTLRYLGRLTTGTGRPGVAWGCTNCFAVMGANTGAGDYVVAPSGPLTLQDVAVLTHQVSISLPIR